MSSIILTNSKGEQVGFSKVATIESLPDAIPLVPITGFPHPPIGYDLPADAYTVEMQGHSGSSSYFSVITDTLALTFGYTDADSMLSDHLHIDDGLAVCFQNQLPKTANFQAIVIEDQSERAFDFNNCQISQNDSLHFSVPNRRDLKVVNVGSQKSYDLSLRYAAAVGSAIFGHSDIALAPNASHRIAPVWEDLDSQPVTIFIDEGNDGTVDDSLIVENQVTSVETGAIEQVPQSFALHQNYPNPFNPSTTIEFSLPKSSPVVIKIYDLLGREVALLVDDVFQPGTHKVIWNAADLPSGVYIYHIRAGEFTDSRKLILLK